MRQRLASVLIVGAVLGAGACDRACSDAPRRAVTPTPTVRHADGCDLWGDRISYWVRVTGTEICTESNAGDRRCVHDLAEADALLAELHTLVPNDTLMIVPETEEPDRIARVRSAIRAAGFRDPRLCVAYTQIHDRRNGGRDYPRYADGRDHACAVNTVLYEPVRSAGMNIERWCQFEDGERQGLYASFSSVTRRPIEIGTYRLGLKHSLWLVFDANGERSRDQWWEDGRPSAPPQ